MICTDCKKRRATVGEKCALCDGLTRAVDVAASRVGERLNALSERTARLAAEARVKELENALLTCSQWAGNAAYNIRQHGLPTDMMACANTFDGIEKRARSTLHPGDGG